MTWIRIDFCRPARGSKHALGARCGLVCASKGKPLGCRRDAYVKTFRQQGVLQGLELVDSSHARARPSVKQAKATARLHAEAGHSSFLHRILQARDTSGKRCPHGSGSFQVRLPILATVRTFVCLVTKMSTQQALSTEGCSPVLRVRTTSSPRLASPRLSFSRRGARL